MSRATDATDALQAYEEAARRIRCQSNLNGGSCVCEPACTEECYVAGEPYQPDPCDLSRDRAIAAAEGQS